MVRLAVDLAAARMGGLNLLVNAAGIYAETPLASFDLDAFDRMVAVNLRGTAIMAREALRHFVPGARIINIASELAFLGRAGASGYCATKGAIVAMTRSWARELGPGILVNAVAPGPIDTPLLAFEALPEAVKALEVSNPLGRIGQAGRGGRRDRLPGVAGRKFHDRPVYRRRWRRDDAMRSIHD